MPPPPPPPPPHAPPPSEAQAAAEEETEAEAEGAARQDEETAGGEQRGGRRSKGSHQHAMSRAARRAINKQRWRGRQISRGDGRRGRCESGGRWRGYGGAGEREA